MQYTRRMNHDGRAFRTDSRTDWGADAMVVHVTIKILLDVGLWNLRKEIEASKSPSTRRTG